MKEISDEWGFMEDLYVEVPRTLARGTFTNPLEALLDI